MKKIYLLVTMFLFSMFLFIFPLSVNAQSTLNVKLNGEDGLTSADVYPESTFNFTFHATLEGGMLSTTYLEYYLNGSLVANLGSMTGKNSYAYTKSLPSTDFALGDIITFKITQSSSPVAEYSYDVLDSAPPAIFDISLTSDNFTYTNGGDSDYGVMVFRPDGSEHGSIGLADATTFGESYLDGFTGTTWLANFGTGLYGTWHFMEVLNSGGCNIDPASNSYSLCVATGDYLVDIPIIFDDPAPPTPPTDSGLTGIMATSEDAFASATGLEYSDVQTWSNTNLALVIGSGLGVLVSVIPWIIALLVIGAIVFFLYRGFRFFKH